MNPQRIYLHKKSFGERVLPQFLGGMSVALALASSAANAQTSSSTSDKAVGPDGRNLEEIVVTAEKRRTNLQKTPLAISAATAETIEARALTGVGSIGSIAPGLTITPAPLGLATVSVFIRGIGNNDPILTADSPVAVYVDGIILGRSAGSAFDIADLDRIEVLRGPQGTLYGRNTIGGAINLITRKPSDNFEARQKISLGNYGYWQSHTTLNTGEIGDTGLRASFAYLHKQRNGYVDNLNEPKDSRDPGAYKTNGGRVALAYDRGNGIRASYTFDFNRNKGFAIAPQATAARPDLVAFFADSPAAGGGTFIVSPTRLSKVRLDHNGPITDKISGHTLTLEADLDDDLTLKSLTGYRKWRQTVDNSSLDAQANLLGPVLGQGAILEPITLFSADNRLHQHQWSQEVNLIGKLSRSLDYVLGAYYFSESSHETNPQRFDFITPGGALPLMALLDYGHKSSTKALFAQSTYHATDRLNLTGGIRYTWDKKKLQQLAPVTRRLARNFTNFNWTLSVDYDFGDSVFGYARVATGYKAGGFNARSNDPNFDPEDLVSYELGVKADIFDQRLRFNTAIFLAKHKRLQVQQFEAGTGGATSITANAGKAQYKGIELELTAIPVNGLTTYAMLGYVHPEYKEFIVRDPATDKLIDISGEAKFPYAASTTLNGGAEYRLPPFDIGQLTVRLDYNFLSKRYFNPSFIGSPFLTSIAADKRGLLDARMTLSKLRLGGANASISVWGRNITGKKYRVAGVDFGSLGFATNMYGEPATWGMDILVDF